MRVGDENHVYFLYGLKKCILSNKLPTIKGIKKCVRKNWELINANEEDKKSNSAELIALFSIRTIL